MRPTPSSSQRIRRPVCGQLCAAKFVGSELTNKHRCMYKKQGEVVAVGQMSAATGLVGPAREVLQDAWACLCALIKRVAFTTLKNKSAVVDSCSLKM